MSDQQIDRQPQTPLNPTLPPLPTSPPRRRSSRERSAPVRLGFTNTLTTSVETLTEEFDSDSDTFPRDLFDASPEPTSTMEGLTPAQQAQVNQLIKDSVSSAVAAAVTQALAQFAINNPRQETRTPSPSRDRSVRALTADLQPTADYYLPKLNPAVPAVEPNKVKYPRIPFSDHKGEIEYDAWKMDMKLFIQKYSGNFTTGESQVYAYFECTKGEAKTIILQRMDPDFAGDFNGAADVLKALDQRFFDHNRVQAAKLKYNQLQMGSMTYNEFRTKFTTYAATGKISPTRWFDDICEKVSDELKYDICTKKYEFGGDYIALDEFLAVSDRELRNIAAGRATVTAREAPRVSFNNTNATDSRGTLKKDDWRSTSLTPASHAWGLPTSRLSPEALPRSPSPVPALRQPELPVPPPAPRDIDDYNDLEDDTIMQLRGRSSLGGGGNVTTSDAARSIGWRCDGAKPNWED